MSEREEPKFFSVTEISNMLGSSQSRTYELLAAHNCSKCREGFYGEILNELSRDT